MIVHGKFDRAPFVGRKRELEMLKKHFGQGNRVAFIVGERGVGKTSLAFMFGHLPESTKLFSGGWQHISASPLITMEDLLPRAPKKPTLFVFDDVDFIDPSFLEFIRRAPSKYKYLNVIVCGTGPIPIDLKEALTIRLGGLTQEEFFKLIEHRLTLSGKDRIYARQLFELVAGHPLYANLASTTIQDLVITVEQFINGLGEFRHSGILGPDGRPFTRIPRSVQVDVVNTNAELLEKLRYNPDLFRDLTPRRFEEIVAELLSQQGYSVELTPPSQDGGFDIWAARKDGLGRFLFLVECKQYTPPNKVGVSIVRSLHGVVQQAQANAGIVVTSSFFTRGAKEFQQRVPYQMQLKDYIEIQNWLGVL